MRLTNSVIIIQARTASTRLPRKAFLPIGENPSSLLAALRASNLGGELVVATSDHSSDDDLADLFLRRGMKIFRGPMEDVLARYYFASAEYSDDSVIVRLTADNVVPDGMFVQELTAAFASSACEYLATPSPQSHLPYGLGAEVFRLSTLRRAHAFATSPGDREHVSPWIRRNCKSEVYIPNVLKNADYSFLRCTIDDQEDYNKWFGYSEVSKIRSPWGGLI